MRRQQILNENKDNWNFHCHEMISIKMKSYNHTSYFRYKNLMPDDFFKQYLYFASCRGRFILTWRGKVPPDLQGKSAVGLLGKMCRRIFGSGPLSPKICGRVESESRFEFFILTSPSPSLDSQFIFMTSPSPNLNSTLIYWRVWVRVGKSICSDLKTKYDYNISKNPTTHSELYLYKQKLWSTIISI